MSDRQSSKKPLREKTDLQETHTSPEENTLETLDEEALDGILIACLRNRAAHTPETHLKEWTVDQLRQLTLTEKKILLALLQEKEL